MGAYSIKIRHGMAFKMALNFKATDVPKVLPKPSQV